jgi:hypothetical protein
MFDAYIIPQSGLMAGRYECEERSWLVGNSPRESSETSEKPFRVCVELPIFGPCACSSYGYGWFSDRLRVTNAPCNKSVIPLQIYRIIILNCRERGGVLMLDTARI